MVNRFITSSVATVASVATVSVLLIAPVQAQDNLSTNVRSTTPTLRALPSGSVPHRSQYWTWFGPRNWTAATGAYGITIYGPKKRVVDYGFSSTMCANGYSVGESVRNYFAGKRAELKRSAGKRYKFKTGRIVQLPAGSYGANYFRQGISFAGRSGRTKVRGEVIYDYRVDGGYYCFQRGQSRTVPAGKKWKTYLKQLRSIQSKLAYFGPGA